MFSIIIHCLKTIKMSVQPSMVVISPHICVCTNDFFAINIRYCFCTFARIQTSYPTLYAVLLLQSQLQQIQREVVMEICVY